MPFARLSVLRFFVGTSESLGVFSDSRLFATGIVSRLRFRAGEDFKGLVRATSLEASKESEPRTKMFPESEPGALALVFFLMDGEDPSFRGAKGVLDSRCSGDKVALVGSATPGRESEVPDFSSGS